MLCSDISPYYHLVVPVHTIRAAGFDLVTQESCRNLDRDEYVFI
jgi:hypothetical protein